MAQTQTKEKDPPSPMSRNVLPLERLALPSRLWVPSPAHDQTPHEFLEPGTHVVRGESLLASKDSTWKATLLPRSPADGTLLRVTQVQLLNGQAAQAAEILVEAQQAGAHDDIPAADATPPPNNLPELIDRLRQSGTWSDRRTSPDLLAQLAHGLKRPLDTVLCNALDADGSQELNATLLRHRGAEVMAGLLLLARASGAGRTWIAVDARAAAVASVVVRKSARGAVRVVSMANDYPQADPTLLLYALLGRKLRPGRLPVEQGVLLLDAAAAIAVSRAAKGEAMLDVPLAVRDAQRRRSHFVTVVVGTPIRFVLEQLHISPRDVALRAGAALRDVRISCDAIVAGAELAIDAGPAAQPINPDPCIRCGWCVAACPARIHPAGLLEAAQENDRAMAKRYGIEACIECGICSYVCPSRLPLVESIRAMRPTVSPAHTT